MCYIGLHYSLILFDLLLLQCSLNWHSAHSFLHAWYTYIYIISCICLYKTIHDYEKACTFYQNALWE